MKEAHPVVEVFEAIEHQLIAVFLRIVEGQGTGVEQNHRSEGKKGGRLAIRHWLGT